MGKLTMGGSCRLYFLIVMLYEDIPSDSRNFVFIIEKFRCELCAKVWI